MWTNILFFKVADFNIQTVEIADIFFYNEQQCTDIMFALVTF